MKRNIIGLTCDCGHDVFVMSDRHPYVLNTDFKLKEKCKNCGKENVITKDKAINFYEKKVRDVFSGVFGCVLEIGCGGGFLTEALLVNKNVKKIVAVDIDDDLNNNLKQNKKLTFLQLDLNTFKEKDLNQKFDFIVCKDVLMYLNDCDSVIQKLQKLSNNILFLNWFNKDHKNCKNKNSGPIKVKRVFKKYFDKVELSYPKLYNYCYKIEAKRTVK